MQQQVLPTRLDGQDLAADHAKALRSVLNARDARTNAGDLAASEGAGQRQSALCDGVALRHGRGLSVCPMR